MILLKHLLEKKGSGAVSVAETASVGDAIRVMNQRRVGSALVPSADGKPLGILTERDVMRLCAEGKTNFDELSVKDHMTTELVLANPDDRVSETLAIMTERRFRHMPVVEDGRVIGMISIGDLVKAKLEQTVQEAEALRHYISS